MFSLSLSLSHTHTHSLAHSQIEQVQKGLLLQAQSGLQLAEQMRHMFIAQLRIADILGTSTSDNSCKQHSTGVQYRSHKLYYIEIHTFTKIHFILSHYNSNLAKDDTSTYWSL